MARRPRKPKNRPTGRAIGFTVKPGTIGVELTVVETTKSGEKDAMHTERDRRKDEPTTSSGVIETINRVLGDFFERLAKEGAEEDTLDFGKSLDAASGPAEGSEDTGTARPEEPAGKFQKPKRKRGKKPRAA